MSKTLAVANGDIFINARGSGDWITGRDKMSQDFAEMVLSDLDPTRNYGTKLNKVVVGVGAARGFITSELHSAVNKLQQHQQEDPKCTQDERLASMTNLSVTVENRDAFFSLALHTAKGETLSVQDGIKLRAPKLGHLLSNITTLSLPQ